VAHTARPRERERRVVLTVGARERRAWTLPRVCKARRRRAAAARQRRLRREG